MLTEGTKDAFLIIESVDPSRHDDLMAAMDLLGENAVKCLGGEMTAKVLINSANPIMEI
jgi:DNA/RNA-binding domain of Phe-tRNA-synthetase-like protein